MSRISLLVREGNLLEPRKEDAVSDVVLGHSNVKEGKDAGTC